MPIDQLSLGAQTKHAVRSQMVRNSCRPSNGLRCCFVAGIFLLALFIVCRIAPYAFPNLHASIRWLF